MFYYLNRTMRVISSKTKIDSYNSQQYPFHLWLIKDVGLVLIDLKKRMQMLNTAGFADNKYLN